MAPEIQGPEATFMVDLGFDENLVKLHALREDIPMGSSTMNILKEGIWIN